MLGDVLGVVLRRLVLGLVLGGGLVVTDPVHVVPFRVNDAGFPG